MRRIKNDGFTIVELMIATVVFSVVMLVVTGGIIQIGRLYYKGITATRTQGVTRSIMEDVSQAIQFNTGTVSDESVDDNNQSTMRCIGNREYDYLLGQQVKDGKHGLVVQSELPTACTTIPDMTSTSIAGQELLGQHMRLAKFEINPLDNHRYEIIIRVVYGEDDLLCATDDNPDIQGANGTSCTDSAPMDPAIIPQARDLACKNIRSGSQFCAMSELKTTVERRLL